MENANVNVMAGVTVLNGTDIETLIRDSEKLRAGITYIQAVDYISKDVLLAILCGAEAGTDDCECVENAN